MIASGLNHRLATAFTSAPVVTTGLLLKNYLASFDLSYLFIHGGSNPWHSLGVLNVGNLNPALLIPIILGGWVIMTKIKQPAYKLLAGYILLSPLPSALTVDAPATNRLMDFHLGLTLAAALGLSWLIGRRQDYRVWAILAISALVYLFFWLNFWFKYNYLHASNLSDSWPVGIKETVLQVKQIAHQYDQIYIDLNQTPEHQFAYIYFLLYTWYDPNLLHQSGQIHRDFVYQSTNKFEPYQVIDLENVAGMTPEEKLALFPEGGQKVLIVDRINHGAAYEAPLWLIKNSRGEPNWQLIELDR